MQTTLLGIAIALILALVTALVGPLLVDWSGYRPAIEAEASRLIGAPVRITGPIEVSILPSPSLKLRGLEVGPSHAGSSIRVRALNVELSLGSLVRGQWRAAELHLVGPNFNLGVDSTGQLALPPIAPGFDPDRLSIDRLNIEDGYVVLADARNGSRLILDKLWFNGDMRSLAGPFRGDGAFVLGGDLYAYRVAAGKAEDGAVKLRLNIDPLERSLAIEAEGVVTLAAAPRFEGSVSLTRPAGVALPSGKTLAHDPWRLTSKVKASAASALLQGIEFQYGPEERALKLTGTAELKFGDKPRFDGVLSAIQVDLDRAFPSPDARQLPLTALKTLGDSFSGALRPSIPARLGVSIDSLTVAGATVQNVRGDLRSDGEAWNLEGFELRVPGFTQVNLSGRLDLAPGRLGFTGPVDVNSTDPTALVAWLEGNVVPLSGPRMKPFRARGDVTLGTEKIAFNRLTAEIDRKWVEGRFAYAWASGDKPARLDADLNAAELDIDALLAFVDTARGATTFETPREVTLGLGIGRALVGGVEASNVSARFRRDATGLRVERLSIGSFGGTAFEANGRIDTTSSSPHGTMSMRMDARNLAGVVALAEKFAPNAADLVRRMAQRAPTAQLNATLTLEQAGSAKLAVEGRSGDVRITLRAESPRIGDGASLDLQNLTPKDLRLEARLQSDNGAFLLDLLGLRSFVAADAGRPGELTLTAAGQPGQLQLEGRLTAAGLDASANGIAKLSAEPKADLRLTLASADLSPLRRPALKASIDPLPVSLAGNFAVTGHSVALNDFSGTFAGIPARGSIAVDFTRATRIEGRIETDSIDVPDVLAASVGMPASAGRSWSTEPFGRGVLDAVEGRVEFRVARADITPSFVLLQARGIAKFGRSEIAITDIEGGLADGQAKGQLVFHRSDDGLLARGRLRLTNADAAKLLARDSNPVTGHVALQLDLEGTGLSPQALIGSLAGNGVVSLSQAHFAALNAKVFETATRAVDAGTGLDMKKIGEMAGEALESGTLTVPSAEGVVTVSHGQVRFIHLATRAEGADLTIAGSVDLMEQNLSARLSLSGGKDMAHGTSERPMVSVFLSGSLDNPKRIVDVSTLTTWLTLRGVEQQSRQLEAMEAKRRLPASRQPLEPPRESRTTSTAPVPAWMQAPLLPPAIEVPPLPGVMEQKPARAPARSQSGTAAQPRPVPPKPLPLLPGAN